MAVCFDGLNLGTGDSIPSQCERPAAERRHLVFYVAHVQRPRRGEACVDKVTSALPRTPARNAGNSAL